MKTAVFIWLFMFLAGNAHAQDSVSRYLRFKTVTSTDLLLGVHWQGNTREEKTYRYYEIGIAKGRYVHHPHGVTGGAVYVSEEVYFGNGGNIYGTKIGAWMHWLFDAGLAAVYYTNFEKGNFKIRPELGVGMGRLRIVVGYNIPTINNKAFELLKSNNLQISIQFTAGMKKKEVPDILPLFKRKSRQQDYH